MKRFTEHLNAAWKDEEKELNALYEKALSSIKRPRFQYAFIDDKNRISIRIKPFWKWGSTTRLIKIKSVRSVLPPKNNYYK